MVVITRNVYNKERGWFYKWAEYDLYSPQAVVNYPYEMVIGGNHHVFGVACQLPTLIDKRVSIGIDSPQGSYLKPIDASRVNTREGEATPTAA